MDTRSAFFSCVASSLLQEELLFLYITEISDDEEYAHFLLYVKFFRSLERSKPLELSTVNGWSIMAMFVDLL